MPQNVCILGATGSIGENCLAVLNELAPRFRVVSLAAHRNVHRLLESAKAFGAARICLADCSVAEEIDRQSLGAIELGCGQESLVELATDPEVDIVVNAMVGSAGLAPSVAALKAGKRLALANKESLVMAGAHLIRLAGEKPGAEIIPVDSEHSALFQLIDLHELRSALEKVIITASGGPFRGSDRARLEKVTFAESLNHPTWRMGPKITIDSASLANKGLEIIEAHFLFGLEYENIEVLVHPQSIVHGMAVFHDGAVLAHIGVPDMRIPIQYALTYPDRVQSSIRPPDLAAIGELTFESVDGKNFPCLALAYEAGRKGGVATAVFNAANEAAVKLFSKGLIAFTQIPVIIEKTLAEVRGGGEASLEEIFQADSWARDFAIQLIA